MSKKPESNRKPKTGCLSRVAGSQPLTRVLCSAGIGPASECEGLVRGGLVAVEGIPVKNPAARVDPFRQQITVRELPLPLASACRYLLHHKPYGVLCAFTDPEGRPTLADYVSEPDVYAAGRLDLDSEGLLLLTDDGWLIHRLGHPRYGHRRTYLVQVERRPDPDALDALRRGVLVKGRASAPAEVALLPGTPNLPERSKPIRYRKSVPTAWIRLTLTEGRKRQVRHMTAAIGHPTLRLVRVSIGPLELGSLGPGEVRPVTAAEIEALQTAMRAAERR